MARAATDAIGACHFNASLYGSPVQRGLGVAVISALAVQEELAAGKLLSFDLDRSGVFRRIYLAWPAGCPLTAAERRFADYVLSHAESE